MPRVIEEFGKEVRQRLAIKGWSFRRATIASEIPHTTIGAMADGVVPGENHIIKWAKALKEPINYWLELAGYDPIALELCGVQDMETEEFLRLKYPNLSDSAIDNLASEVRDMVAKYEARPQSKQPYGVQIVDENGNPVEDEEEAKGPEPYIM